MSLQSDLQAFAQNPNDAGTVEQLWNDYGNANGVHGVNEFSHIVTYLVDNGQRRNVTPLVRTMEHQMHIPY